MADKSTQLIVAALSRAATEPAGLALFGTKSEPGLFPSGAVSKPAAARCIDDGLLRVLRTEARGKSEQPIVTLTEKGLQYLTRETDPRHVLEDFVRVLELRQEEARQLRDSADRMDRSLAAMRDAAGRLLPRLAAPTTNGKPHMNSCLPALTPTTPASVAAKPELCEALLDRLAEWHAAAGASEDCPLPELYGRLAPDGPPPTVGEFHDTLRHLHAEGRVYLHPWTGPLYALPEPTFALLIGHEIAYYASVRS